MRCLLTALGSYGDVHPMIGLGAAMQARGHEVYVFANPYFRSIVEAAGLRFVGVLSAEDYEGLTESEDLWHPRRGLELVLRSAVVSLLDVLYDSVAEHVEPGETVIGAHGLDLSSRVVAESLGVPVTSVVYAPMVMWSDASPPRMPFGFSRPRWLCRAQFRFGERVMSKRLVERPLNALRSRVGLGPLRGRYFDWYYGVAPPLCLFPDWFAPDPGDWPEGVATTGFPLWDGAAEEGLAPEAERFLDEGTPPIVFTPGSANRHAATFFVQAARACESLGRRGVLLTKYAEQLPEDLPETVRPFGFVPLSRLLPQAAAFVHHGGIGSCAQGLAAGVPQLIRPQGFDQFDNALRLRRLGVAEELLPKRFRAEAVAAALDRLLRDEGVGRRCRENAARCDADGALSAACERLEARFAEAQ